MLNPRGTVGYGGDTLLAYVEGYDFPRPDHGAVRGPRRAATASIYATPSASAAGGAVESQVVRLAPDSAAARRARAGRSGSGAAAKQTSALVSFSGAGWSPTTTRCSTCSATSATTDRLNASCKKAPPSERPRLWREFYRQTDPIPDTPENEALEQYFSRMAIANQRFTDEGVPGWRTDRGEVFITLGAAGRDLSNARPATQGRIIRWTYTSYRLEVYFQDETGFGRFRLTSDSRAELRPGALARRASRGKRS